MTTLRKAATQALEVLELVTDLTNHDDEIYDAIDALKAALAEPTLTQQMTDAGFTPRDNRLTCDECGGKFTRQMLPIHKCAALAKPMQEPVAWIHTDPDKPRVKFLEWRENEPGYRGDWIKTPLYAAPPQRKPLTEEEIDGLMQSIGLRCADDGNERMANHAEWERRQRRRIARAIERTHGIK